MLPVLVRFTFDAPWAQWLLYVLALGAVLFIGYSGWRSAEGKRDKNGKVQAATPGDKLQRGALFAIGAGALARFGLLYALPASAFLGGKGEGLPLHTYGILLAAGFMCAVSVAGRLAQNEWRKVTFVEGRGWVDTEGPRKREQVMDMAFWALIGGLVGSRVLFILVNWKDYMAQPSRFLSLGGGLVFYGGLIGATLAAYLFARKNEMDFLRLADVCIPTVSLGQCLGRLGCFGAGCCWGDTAGTHVSWAAQFPGFRVAKDIFGRLGGTSSMAFQSQAADSRYVVEATGELFHQVQPGAVRVSEWVTQHGVTLPVHPTQIYESIGQLVIFVTLLFLRRYRRFHGQILALWLMAYAVLRTTVELFRGDVERGTLHGLLNYLGAERLAEAVPLEAWFNMSVSQFISLCMFSFGVILFYQRGHGRSVASVGAAPRPA